MGVSKLEYLMGKIENHCNKLLMLYICVFRIDFSLRSEDVFLLQGAVKVMAKDLVRTRHQIEKFYKLKSQLQGVSLRIQVYFVS